MNGTQTNTNAKGRAMATITAARKLERQALNWLVTTPLFCDYDCDAEQLAYDWDCPLDDAKATLSAVERMTDKTDYGKSETSAVTIPDDAGGATVMLHMLIDSTDLDRYIDPDWSNARQDRHIDAMIAVREAIIDASPAAAKMFDAWCEQQEELNREAREHAAKMLAR